MGPAVAAPRRLLTLLTATAASGERRGVAPHKVVRSPRLSVHRILKELHVVNGMFVTLVFKGLD